MYVGILGADNHADHLMRRAHEVAEVLDRVEGRVLQADKVVLCAFALALPDEGRHDALVGMLLPFPAAGVGLAVAASHGKGRDALAVVVLVCRRVLAEHVRVFQALGLRVGTEQDAPASQHVAQYAAVKLDHAFVRGALAWVHGGQLLDTLFGHVVHDVREHVRGAGLPVQQNALAGLVDLASPVLLNRFHWHGDASLLQGVRCVSHKLLRPADPGEVCEEPDAAVENHTEPVASGGVQLQCRGQVGWPVHEIGRRHGPCGPVAALLPVAALKGASFTQAFGQLVPEVRLRGVTVDRSWIIAVDLLIRFGLNKNPNHFWTGTENK